MSHYIQQKQALIQSFVDRLKVEGCVVDINFSNEPLGAGHVQVTFYEWPVGWMPLRELPATLCVDTDRWPFYEDNEETFQRFIDKLNKRIIDVGGSTKLFPLQVLEPIQTLYQVMTT